MALVDTRNRTFRPSASEMKVTLHRFGRNRRLVLIFEWLTLWPTCGPLAVSSQRRDIVQNPLPSPSLRHCGRGGPKSCPFREPRTYRGGRAARQGFRAVEAACKKAGFAGVPQGLTAAYPMLTPSYKGRIRRRNLSL